MAGFSLCKTVPVVSDGLAVIEISILLQYSECEREDFTSPEGP